MSDYENFEDDLPLFASGPPLKNASRGANFRESPNHDEIEHRETVVASVLGFLEINRSATTLDLIKVGGHRFSCAIQSLREAGYHIKMERSEESRGYVYQLVGFAELSAVTEEMKQLYYATEHWRVTAQNRKQFDSWRCNLCHSSDRLEAHHWVYNLFAEKNEELETYCRECHKSIHRHVTIGWPKSVSETLFRKIMGVEKCN